MIAAGGDGGLRVCKAPRWWPRKPAGTDRAQRSIPAMAHHAVQCTVRSARRRCV